MKLLTCCGSWLISGLRWVTRLLGWVTRLLRWVTRLLGWIARLLRWISRLLLRISMLIGISRCWLMVCCWILEKNNICFSLKTNKKPLEELSKKGRETDKRQTVLAKPSYHHNHTNHLLHLVTFPTDDFDALMLQNIFDIKL